MANYVPNFDIAKEIEKGWGTYLKGSKMNGTRIKDIQKIEEPRPGGRTAWTGHVKVTLADGSECYWNPMDTINNLAHLKETYLESLKCENNKAGAQKKADEKKNDNKEKVAKLAKERNILAEKLATAQELKQGLVGQVGKTLEKLEKIHIGQPCGDAKCSANQDLLQHARYHANLHSKESIAVAEAESMITKFKKDLAALDVEIRNLLTK